MCPRAVLTTAMSSMSIAVAIATTASVQLRDGMAGVLSGKLRIIGGDPARATLSSDCREFAETPTFLAAMGHRLLLIACLLAFGLLPSSALASGWTTYDRPAQYGEVVDKDVPITMSDGVVLRADVHRPDQPGRYPVLITQTPYNKQGVLAGANSFLVQRGYVHVVVDVRG